MKVQTQAAAVLAAMACGAPGVLAPAQAAAPACGGDPRIAQVAQQWRNALPIGELSFANVQAARCFRRQFIAALQPSLGPLVGYKVGIFSKAGRAAYNTDEPRLGYLYANMLLPEGRRVFADYGVGATWESDLLVVVKDGGINTARSREDIYKHLSGFRPFIELTNRNYGPEVKISAEQLEALDVGARLGIEGAEIALPQTPKGMADFVNLSAEATLRTPDGKETTERAKSLDTLGDPLDIVAFARDAVLRDGGRLKAGDVISLGIFTPGHQPHSGEMLMVRYTITPQPATISTRFD